MDIKMAKTIKFNLICDNYPVRTIEDLQEHFSFEDIREYYNNRLLHKWLEVRGYEKELKMVNAINVKDTVKILKELSKIFDVTLDDEEVYHIILREERKKKSKAVHEVTEQKEDIIQEYAKGYDELVQQILDNPDDTNKVKTNIRYIVSTYKWMFKRDYKNLFYVLYDNNAWFAIMCLLMNAESRKYYIYGSSDNASAKNEGIILRKEREIEREKILEYCTMITDDHKIREKLHCTCVTHLNTQGQWYRLGPEGKRYMLLHMTSGSQVKLSSGKETKITKNIRQVSEDVLEWRDVNGHYPIVDGILYKSNSTLNSLYYMEV